MRRPSRRTWKLLALAAAQRACAAEWSAIARLVGRSERACRSWPHKYREVWDRLYAEADIRMWQLAAAEGAQVLARMEWEKREKQAQLRFDRKAPEEVV
jgi:hypothetical protein